MSLTVGFKTYRSDLPYEQMNQVVDGIRTLIEELRTIAELFYEAATVDPLSAFLFVFGMVLITGVLVFTGVLALGAVLDVFRS